MSSERTDPHGLAIHLDPGKPINAADIHEQGRLSNTQLHRGNEAVPACEQFCIRVFLEHPDGIGYRCSSIVIYVCRVHVRLLSTFFRGLDGAPDSFRSKRHVQMLDAQRG